MRKLWNDKVSRRRLLGGAAATSAALPVLHELIPHQGLHGGTSAAHAAVEHEHTAHRGAGHLGAVGRVDHAGNGFDPQAILRDFDEGTVRGGVREWELVAEDREIEVAPGVKYAAWTYNGRVPGPTLRAREGERLRIRFVNGSRHPHTIHFHGIHRDVMDGVPGVGAGNIAPRRVDRLRVRRHPVRPAPLPLPLEPAGRAHRQGPLRRVRDRPQGGPRRGRRARDGDERVRHELRPLQRGLRGQLGRLRVHGRAGPGEARRAGADLPRQRARVRPPQLVPHPRQLLRLLPDRHAPRAARLHRHRHPGSGRAGHPRAALPYAGKYMFHAHVSEFAELGWMGFFEVTE